LTNSFARLTKLLTHLMHLLTNLVDLSCGAIQELIYFVNDVAT
jgi:hypothetical protein